MLPRDVRAGSFRRAFFCTAPGRYAVALTLDQVRRRDQHYDERRGPITGTMIACLSNQLIDSDADPAGVGPELRWHLRENSSSSLPARALRASESQLARRKAASEDAPRRLNRKEASK